MTDEDRGPEVVLMCGLAGSGKTTYSKELETRGYVRLSVDEEVWERFGRFGVDYDASLYEAHSAVARRSLDERLTSLVTQGRDVVVDSSLWQRVRREECRRRLERHAHRQRPRLRRADRLDHVAHAEAAGELADGRDSLLAAGLHDVCCTEA